MPASLANETVVNQNVLLREPATVSKAPVENFRVGFARKHLCSNIFIADPYVPTCPAIESLSQTLMVILRKSALRMQPNFGAHPRKIKDAAGLFETTLESLNFHSDMCVGNESHGQPQLRQAQVATLLGASPNRHRMHADRERRVRGYVFGICVTLHSQRA